MKKKFKFINPLINTLKPYVPGEQSLDSSTLKLNTNENPFSPSPKVKEAIQKCLLKKATLLRLYPEPESDSLKKALAKYFKLRKNSIFIGNGSDEVLAFCFMSFFAGRGVLSMPDITYSFYPSLAKLFGVSVETFPLAHNFEIDLSQIPKASNSIVIPNPNAITGLMIDKKKLIKYVLNNPNKLFLIDEAYVDFGSYSCIPLIRDRICENLIVVQTFSKSRSLAGLRLGFCVGSEELISALTDAKNSFNSYPVDRLACSAGVAALGDREWFKSSREQIISNRSFLTEEFTRIGFRVIPSKGNFLLISHRKANAVNLFEYLMRKKVLVRYFKHGRLRNWLRISIGSLESCKKVLSLLKDKLC